MGTLSGHLSLWDLRFGLLLRTWRAGDGNKPGAVLSSSVHLTRGKGRWIVVASEGGEGLDVWNIETGKKVETFNVTEGQTSHSSAAKPHRRTSSGATANSRTFAEVQLVTEVELNPSTAIELLLKSDVQLEEPFSESVLVSEPATALHGFKHRSSGPNIRTVLLGNDYASSNDNAILAIGSLPSVSEAASVIGSSGGSSVSVNTSKNPGGQAGNHDTGWIITGGEDKKLRFWDLANVERSCIICGAEEGEERPVYSVSHDPGKSDRCITYLESGLPHKPSGGGPNKRSQLIANNQQTLLKAHQDAITTLALLDLPFRCIVSGDRSGVIKVWE